VHKTLPPNPNPKNLRTKNVVVEKEKGKKDDRVIQLGLSNTRREHGVFGESGKWFNPHHM
jgi:hypothetical protein